MASNSIEERKKGISIGVEDFKEIIVKNGYFVDKTLMIEEIIESNAKVTLLTRPRRFGKTLNQSMIRRFFEDEITEHGEKIDNGYLFEGLKISKCGEEVLRHKQQYPVISVSLKSAKQGSFDMAYASLIDEISKEFNRHSYVLESDCIPQTKKKEFEDICNKRATAIDYAKAFGILSECLAKYHGKNVFILIDEYDVPLENAYFEGFYDDMLKFIRSLFESALKTNPYLEKGIITGCLRISKESIFTGLNNLSVNSLLGVHYADCFGFTQDEVTAMAWYYGLESKLDEIKQWYDGYRFGEHDIYNPWSIINYIDNARVAPYYLPRPYWSNTSSNNIVREMVENADDDARKDLETLMNGGTIEKVVHEDITYGDIHENMDNLWNFLFFTGYLKNSGERQEGNKLYLLMSIPNTEVASVYEDSISNWFTKKIKGTDRSPLVEAFENGDCETAAEIISDELLDTISFYDFAEDYYHGFMSGLLTNFGKYRAYSNRESGNGRPDIILKTQRIRNGKAMILEFKKADSVDDLEAKCDEALQQIERQKYDHDLLSEGYKDITKFGICFYKKECMIKQAK